MIPAGPVSGQREDHLHSRWKFLAFLCLRQPLSAVLLSAPSCFVRVWMVFPVNKALLPLVWDRPVFPVLVLVHRLGTVVFCGTCRLSDSQERTPFLCQLFLSLPTPDPTQAPPHLSRECCCLTPVSSRSFVLRVSATITTSLRGLYLFKHIPLSSVLQEASLFPAFNFCSSL